MYIHRKCIHKYFLFFLFLFFSSSGSRKTVDNRKTLLPFQSAPIAQDARRLEHGRGLRAARASPAPKKTHTLQVTRSTYGRSRRAHRSLNRFFNCRRSCSSRRNNNELAIRRARQLFLSQAKKAESKSRVPEDDGPRLFVGEHRRSKSLTDNM